MKEDRKSERRRRFVDLCFTELIRAGKELVAANTDTPGHPSHAKHTNTRPHQGFQHPGIPRLRDCILRSLVQPVLARTADKELPGVSYGLRPSVATKNRHHTLLSLLTRAFHLPDALPMVSQPRSSLDDCASAPDYPHLGAAILQTIALHFP